MIEPRPNADLSTRNTLGIPSRAQWLVEIDRAEDLPAWVAWARERHLAVRALGGGSNLLVDAEVDGLVLALCNPGRDCLGHTGDGRELWRLAAGESWHDCVRFSVERGLSGLENLALIPGSVGAAPIQNIGAYGVELADHLWEVEAYDTHQQRWVRFERSECDFEYRDSRFKRAGNRYIITAITLALSRDFQPRLDYGPLSELAGEPGLTPRHVMDRVVAIRQAKLPDPAQLPNAGSFFKNPLVDADRYRELQQQWPDLVAFPAGEHRKLAAGWLIDQCGLRGRHNEAGVGCYRHQALVVVNPERAGYPAVLAWQETVQAAVRERFGIELEREPRYWGPKSG